MSSMTIMKVGQITHVYPPHIGGIENYVHRLKNSLKNQGVDVTVYTTDMGLAPKQNREKKVHYCKSNLSIYRNPISLELVNKLAKSKEDIYHLHGYEFFSTLFAARILKEHPKILTQHGAEVEGINPMLYFLNQAYYPFAKYILQNMDHIIVLGNKDKAFLMNYFDIRSAKIDIIPNGINISEYKSISKNNIAFLNTFGIHEKSFKILFIGRLVATKNAHRLISAFVKYIRNKNVELIIIGPGEKSYVDKLKNLADERVHILGQINLTNLIASYNVSNLFIQLGEWSEGIPTTILEAMTCGLPILATNVGNISEVVKDGENGQLIDLPIDERELAGKIEYFLSSDNQKMAYSNMLKIQREYNWDMIANKIYNLYLDILSEVK